MTDGASQYFRTTARRVIARQSTAKVAPVCHPARYLVGGCVAAAASYVSAPLVRRLLVRVGAMDIPNERSSHARPVPRGGGIMLAAGMGAAQLAMRPRRVPVGVIVAAGGLAAVGLADDLRGGISPTVRLTAQVVAGLAQGPAASSLLGGVVFPGVVNVVNFMDGINGMSASTAIVWGINAVLVNDGSQEAAAVADLGVMTLGAAAGFLPWNLPDGEIFLGDVGSYLLGGVMAAALARSSGSPRRFARVAAPLGLYLVDAAQALVLKRRRGESLTEAHRGHIYQQLVDGGQFTHGQVALIHGLLAGGVAVAWRNSQVQGLITFATASVIYLSLPRLVALRGAASDGSTTKERVRVLRAVQR